MQHLKNKKISRHTDSHASLTRMLSDIHGNTRVMCYVCKNSAVPIILPRQQWGLDLALSVLSNLDTTLQLSKIRIIEPLQNSLGVP